MKIRSGFVSNSSSSSFICGICSREWDGYDWEILNVGRMICCENGHAICVSHIPDMDQLKKLIGASYNEDYSSFNSDLCHRCKMEETSSGISRRHKNHMIKLLSDGQVMCITCDKVIGSFQPIFKEDDK